MAGQNQGAIPLLSDQSPGEDTALELEQFLPYRLSIVAQAVSTALSRLYASRFGLSVPQWRVMAVLGRFQPLSANQVCDKTLMDKVAVSRAVAAMLRRQLLERQVDGQDRRRSQLRLTRKGSAILRQITPLARDYEKNLLAALSPGERQNLGAVLSKLTQQALKA